MTSFNVNGVLNAKAHGAKGDGSTNHSGDSGYELIRRLRHWVPHYVAAGDGLQNHLAAVGELQPVR